MLVVQPQRPESLDHCSNFPLVQLRHQRIVLRHHVDFFRIIVRTVSRVILNKIGHLFVYRIKILSLGQSLHQTDRPFHQDICHQGHKRSHSGW